MNAMWHSPPVSRMPSISPPVSLAAAADGDVDASTTSKPPAPSSASSTSYSTPAPPPEAVVVIPAATSTFSEVAPIRCSTPSLYQDIGVPVAAMALFPSPLCASTSTPSLKASSVVTTELRRAPSTHSSTMGNNQAARVLDSFASSQDIAMSVPCVTTECMLMPPSPTISITLSKSATTSHASFMFAQTPALIQDAYTAVPLTTMEGHVEATLMGFEVLLLTPNTLPTVDCIISDTHHHEEEVVCTKQLLLYRPWLLSPISGDIMGDWASDWREKYMVYMDPPCKWLEKAYSDFSELQKPWPPPTLIHVTGNNLMLRPMLELLSSCCYTESLMEKSWMRPLPWLSFGAYYARIQLNSWRFLVFLSSKHTILVTRIRVWVVWCCHIKQSMDYLLSYSDASLGRGLLNGFLYLYKHAYMSSTENKDWRQPVLVLCGQMVLKANWWHTVIFNFSKQIKIASDASYQFMPVPVQAWKDRLDGIDIYLLMKLPTALRCYRLLFYSNVEAILLASETANRRKRLQPEPWQSFRCSQPEVFVQQKIFGPPPSWVEILAPGSFSLLHISPWSPDYLVWLITPYHLNLFSVYQLLQHVLHHIDVSLVSAVQSPSMQLEVSSISKLTSSKDPLTWFSVLLLHLASTPEEKERLLLLMMQLLGAMLNSTPNLALGKVDLSTTACANSILFVLVVLVLELVTIGQCLIIYRNCYMLEWGSDRFDLGKGIKGTMHSVFLTQLGSHLMHTSFARFHELGIVSELNGFSFAASQMLKLLTECKSNCVLTGYSNITVSFKAVQVPWDPGGIELAKIFASTAWGQAVFQEGKYVRILSAHYRDWVSHEVHGPNLGRWNATVGLLADHRQHKRGMSATGEESSKDHEEHDGKLRLEASSCSRLA